MSRAQYEQQTFVCMCDNSTHSHVNFTFNTVIHYSQLCVCIFKKSVY